MAARHLSFGRIFSVTQRLKRGKDGRKMAMSFFKNLCATSVFSVSALKKDPVRGNTITVLPLRRAGAEAKD
jgi:hypothetical protein